MYLSCGGFFLLSISEFVSFYKLGKIFPLVDSIYLQNLPSGMLKVCMLKVLDGDFEERG